MTKLTKNEVVNAIANSNGIGELAFRDYRGSTVRVPVNMSYVTMTGNHYDSGSDYTVTCNILGTNPLKADYGVDVARMYPSTMIDWNKLAKQRMNEVYGSGAFHRESPISKEDLEATYNLTHKKTVEYAKRDVEMTQELYAAMSRTIKNVIHSAPATIVFWMDGTKTVVKAVNEEYDPEKGIAMAFVKKMFGNKGNYFNNIKKWLPKETEAKAEQASETVETVEREGK